MSCRVLGVDACKAGWVGIVLSDGEAHPCFATATATATGDLAEHAGVTGPLDLVAVDMPIGLPDAGRRQADVLARKLAGRRRDYVMIEGWIGIGGGRGRPGWGGGYLGRR